jgi:hypothetical protein
VRFQCPVTGHGPEPVDHVARQERVVVHVHQDLAQVLGLVAIHPVLQQPSPRVGVGEDGRQRLIDLVPDGGGQLAQQCEPRGMGQFPPSSSACRRSVMSRQQ